MQAVLEVYYWVLTVLSSGGEAISWLTTPFNFMNIGYVTPLFLISITGLCAFIPVAVSKWIFS